MDEKEAVKRVRNSFRAKKSRAEVLRGFQKRGYKLEYAEEIIKRANRPKKLLKALLLSFFVILLIFLASYFPLFNGLEKEKIENPYTRTMTANSIYSKDSFVNNSVSVSNPIYPQVITDQPQVEITPEYISYLLNEIGVWKLRRHPFNLEYPIINFVIEGQTFNSIIKKEKITTLEGLDKNADLQFTTKKEILLKAITSEDPKIIFKESIISGESQYEMLASQTELLAKGYLSLYNSLK